MGIEAEGDRCRMRLGRAADLLEAAMPARTPHPAMIGVFEILDAHIIDLARHLDNRLKTKQTMGMGYYSKFHRLAEQNQPGSQGLRPRTRVG